MKILVADDDPITRESLDACLKLEGFDVILAQDGAEALKLWRKHRPELLCLDIMMPHTSGYEVCREVRASQPDVPILFLSAKSEEIDVVVGFQLGADDFIRKPFGKHEFLARLRVAIKRSRPAANARRSFTMRDLVVYPLELRAERRGVEIELSPREIAILELLYQRAGEVVDRNALLDHGWGLNYFPESRTLDQHISKLRKRIELDPLDPQIIETVRAAGYRFRVA
jgi:two-component system, OmpR family, alkaline phosphatase synthesis response regulator PhoP